MRLRVDVPGFHRTIKVQHCTEVDQDHERNKRYYAHVYHRRADLICVGKAFYALPQTHQLAILLHEVGHLLARQDGGERDANLAIREASGIKIRYVPEARYGKRLEWIPPTRKKKAQQFLGIERPAA
jgi:hypothetical protein